MDKAIFPGSSHGHQFSTERPSNLQKEFFNPTTQFFTGQMPFLPPNQQQQSTEGITWAVKMVYLKTSTV